MNFLAPQMLFLLGLLPVIVLLYILKRRHRPHLISSTFLWEKALHEWEANIPFKRLRKNLLLFLQLLMLALLIFGAARPYLRSNALVQQSLIVIIDTSASMQVVEADGSSRLTKALQVVRQLVSDLTGADRMLLVEASHVPRIIQSFTSDKGVLNLALQRVKAKDLSADIEKALNLAMELAKHNTGTEIYLLSDGANFPNLSEWQPELETALRFIAFGERDDNLAITGLHYLESEVSGEQGQLFVKTHNYSRESAGCELVFSSNDVVLDAMSVRLSPGNGQVNILSDIPENVEMLKVQLDIDDALAVDNRAYIKIPILHMKKVLAVSEGNPFLLKALQAVPDLQLSVASVMDYQHNEAFDCYVFDGFLPIEIPKTPFILFDPPLKHEWLGESDLTEGGVVLEWDQHHPLTRFVDFSDIRLKSLILTEMPGWAGSLVESAGGTILWAGEDEMNLRRIVCNFNLLHTNLPLKSPFPIFIANAINWLTEQRTLESAEYWSTGTAIPVMNRGATPLAARFASDTEEVYTVQVPPGGEYFTNTFHSGLYNYSLPDREGQVAVNFIDADESNVTPASNLQLGKQSVAGSREVEAQNLEIWKWFAILALLCLTGEWWVFHRRIA